MIFVCLEKFENATQINLEDLNYIFLFGQVRNFLYRYIVLIIFYQNFMEEEQKIKEIVVSVAKKIDQCEKQWKDKMFANVQSQNQIMMVQEESQQYSKWFENYRNVQGNIKPIGLILYFQFLKSVIILAWILVLISLTTLVINYFGNGLDHFKISDIFSKYILRLTIANQNYYRFDTLSPEQLNSIWIHRGITIISDTICIVAMVIGVLWWRGRSQEIISRYNAKSPKPNLYTLKVYHLPKDITKEEIITHFQYYGKVSQISVIKNYRDIILMVRSLVKKINNYKINEARKEKQAEILQQIKERFYEIKLQYLKKPPSKHKFAFVAFENIKDCNRTHQLYRYGVNPDRLALKGKKIKVSKCKTQPLQINWQNYHLMKKSQSKKKVFQIFLMAVISLAILTGLFLVKASTGRISDHRIKMKNAQVIGLESIDLKDNKEVYSFCSSLTYSEEFKYFDVCSEYLGNYRDQLILMMVFSLIIVTINLLTNRILRALVQIRRYRTIAEKNTFLITSIFVFSLLNSAIMLLIVRGGYIGPLLRQTVQWVLNAPEGSLALETFNQFSRKWYITNGSQLMMNYVISLIIAPHFHILLHFLRYKYRKNLQRKKKKVVLDPDFDYCTFYAMSLKSIFFCLFYSHSMPFFYILLMISLLIQISVTRLLLKNFVREPMFFDTTANETIVRILPYAIFFHTIFALFFLNVDEIFPNQFSFTNIAYSPYLTILNQIKNGYTHAIIIGVMLAFLFYQRRIYRIVIQYWSPTKPQLDKTFREIARNPAFLSSYKMKHNPRYKTISYTLELIQEFLNEKKDLLNASSIKQIGMESIQSIQKSDTEYIQQSIPNKSYSKNIVNEIQTLQSQDQESNDSDSEED